ELLPRKQIPYLIYSAVKRTNPLEETYIDPTFQAYAVAAHALLDQAIQILRNANIQSFTVHTHTYLSRKTEIEYRVEPMGSGYRLMEVTGSTIYGDGTVSSESARGDPSLDRPVRVYEVGHSSLCHDTNVGALVQGCL